MQNSKWKERYISLQAGVVLPIMSDRPVNTFLIQNTNTTNIIYAGPDADTSATIHEIKISPGQWGVIARPFMFDRIFLFSAGAITRVKLIEAITDNPMNLIRSIIGGVSQEVFVTATVGLKASELNREAVTNNLFVKAVKGKTWQRVVAGGAGEQVIKATPGTVYQVKCEGTITAAVTDGVGVAAWQTLNEVTFNEGLRCLTNIRLNFSAAGTAWILYE